MCVFHIFKIVQMLPNRAKNHNEDLGQKCGGVIIDPYGANFPFIQIPD